MRNESRFTVAETEGVVERSEFERAAREQNRAVAERRVEARESGAPCVVETMFAFGGVPYCTTHGVIGPCPHGERRAS